MSLPPEDLEKTEPKEIQSGPLAVAGFFIRTFSTVRKSEPPSEAKTTHVRLITISASHFCEKVRWIFDVLERDPNNPYYYDEDGHPPAFQSQFTLAASNNEASVTPMIVYEEDGNEKVLFKSDVILSRFMPSLYPNEIEHEVRKMEMDIGRRVGSALRCFVYYHNLKDLKKYGSVLNQVCADKNKVSTVESILFDKMLDKGIDKGMQKVMHINEETVVASENALREIFTELSSRLDESKGEYLMDTNSKSFGFTAADLTLAALSYPLIRPPEMKRWTVEDDVLPPAVANLAKELKETTAGQHVLKIYKKHRAVNEDGLVVMKGAKRDKYPWQGVLFLTGSIAAATLAFLFARRQ
jgi:hypothetical protein